MHFRVTGSKAGERKGFKRYLLLGSVDVAVADILYRDKRADFKADQPAPNTIPGEAKFYFSDVFGQRPWQCL